MDNKKIAVIVYKTNDANYSETKKSVEALIIPKGYKLEILETTGANKYAAYNAAMNKSDAKYKIYTNDFVVIKQNNILQKLINLFKMNNKIGIVGVSGAIQLSTHGVSLQSAKRCGKILIGEKAQNVDWGNVGKKCIEVDVVDGWFISTQYDIAWRSDLFSDNEFGDSAQCIEFKRKGYKTVVIEQERSWIWHKGSAWSVNEYFKKIFLDNYSADIYPLVSVIIPTYNRRDWFKLALDSVLNQTYRNFEIFITDNSTEDDTEIMMKEYCARDSRIKYERHEASTANDNWNTARHYNNPKAEYVNWLMDDDMFYPKKLEVMVEAFRNNPDVSIVSSVRDIMDVDGKITGQMPKPSEVLNKTCKIRGEDAGRLIFGSGKNYIGEPTTALLKKSCLRDNDLCWNADESGFYSLVDISTWCQLLSKGNMFWFAEPQSAFRRHDKQVTNWQGNGAIFEIAWAYLFKTSWEKKVFTKTEDEIRERVINWIYSASLRLINAHHAHFHGAEIVTLEKTITAMSKTLYNGFKFDLPPRIFGEKTEEGKIS